MARPTTPWLGIAAALFLAAPLANAETVYKWVDEHGVTQFSAVPPAGHASEKLKVEAPEAAPADAKSAPRPDGRPQDITKGVANPSAADLAAEEKKRTENCATARRNLDALNTRAHVRIKDEKTGEDRYLSPEEHDKWTKDSALRIDEYCKPGAH